MKLTASYYFFVLLHFRKISTANLFHFLILFPYPYAYLHLGVLLLKPNYSIWFMRVGVRLVVVIRNLLRSKE